ncbi:MAG: ATP synthase subunit delta [Rhodothermaceae bacterium]|nr:MAG: ATP synthase subunit delta [Rhodothermaceae bacterium]
MSEMTVARRYAQALIDEASQEGQRAAVDADVAMLREVLTTSRELQLFFRNPAISRERKQAAVKALFEGRVAPLTLRFLHLLIEKRREALIDEVLAAYQDLRNEQEGIVEAEARVALPLDPASEQALVKALERMTDRRVRVYQKQDPALLGGLVVRVGDTVYDGSVRHQLATLRARLEHGTFLNN